MSAQDVPWWMATRASHEEYSTPPSRKTKDRQHRKAKPPKDNYRRKIKAALEGMVLSYDRLGDELDAETLAKVRAAFLAFGDFPATARTILGWEAPAEVVKDETLKPPWEE